MPDGSRKRRHSANPTKRHWYARHRSAWLDMKIALRTPVAVLRTRDTQ